MGSAFGLGFAGRLAAVTPMRLLARALAFVPVFMLALGVQASAGAAPGLATRLHPCAQPPQWRPKVVVIAMFAPEAKVWLTKLGPWRTVAVPGLSQDYPTVSCNHQGLCVMTTGMGHANAAASTMALLASRRFDMRRSYFLIAGIAGINPQLGTLGTAAWARYVVDFGLQWELDAREAPANWPSGYLGINTRSPEDKPSLDYHTEVFQLDEALLQEALRLSRGVQLSDSIQAQAARAKYAWPVATQAPQVVQCDTMSGDTWFSGEGLGQRASAWMRLLTDGHGNYCTTQQEDNATMEALRRGAKAGWVDARRIAILRAGSDFDRPYPGQTSASNLLDYSSQGGFSIALQNLYLAGQPLVAEILGHWAQWRQGLPPIAVNAPSAAIAP